MDYPAYVNIFCLERLLPFIFQMKILSDFMTCNHFFFFQELNTQVNTGAKNLRNL